MGLLAGNTLNNRGDRASGVYHFQRSAGNIVIEPDYLRLWLMACWYRITVYSCLQSSIRIVGPNEHRGAHLTVNLTWPSFNCFVKFSTVLERVHIKQNFSKNDTSRHSIYRLPCKSPSEDRVCSSDARRDVTSIGNTTTNNCVTRLLCEQCLLGNCKR